MTITGRTKLIAHLGYPTESFKAPMIYNPYFEKHGIDAVVVPMGSKPEDYAQFFKLVFKLSNIHGALITMPHKVTTMALLGWYHFWCQAMASAVVSPRISFSQPIVGIR